MAPRPASDRVRDEWRRRIEAEYRSASIAQHLGLWLIQIGAPAALVGMSQRAARDELVHAAHARRVYAAAGGVEVPVLDRASLGLTRHPADPLELDVARVAVDVFCLGETVAVRLFSALRTGCSIKPARAALDRVLRDEVRHRDLGWELLAWLLDQPAGPSVRALLAQELPRMLATLAMSYAPPETRDDAQISPGDRAWGLMSGARYADVLGRSVARDHLPRFARLGVDAAAAWEAARGGDHSVKQASQSAGELGTMK
ncbi:MAG: ferritin-like domain-containing protein [Byssovorax sp.]